MVDCGSKNGYKKKETCLKNIDLRAQNVITILSFIVDVIEEI